ncbi:hypothetical protein FLM48_20885 [Shewanella sp. Scap07]|uniref:hypothetical protein n=1 Tax=Shewanella sp. Scap07 TaxID=2589987 RepID=UPI0015BEB428|nr:hypothetical protein [Shewanella sp. Scap07]QLE87309.1 hypothetical protein FLM48_20885 [Shewanella sp. Scap07]
MGMIIAFAIAIVAMLSLLVSSVILIRLLDQLKGSVLLKRIRLQLLVITPLVWTVIYYFPVQYGPAGSNYDQIITVWCTKTALFILSPAIIAILCRRFNRKSE